MRLAPPTVNCGHLLQERADLQRASLVDGAAGRRVQIFQTVNDVVTR